MAWALGHAIFLVWLGLAFVAYPAAGESMTREGGPASPPSSETQSRLEQIARRFVYRHYGSLSDGPTVADDYDQGIYAETVTLNGATLTRDEVLAVKRRQSEQWPEQTYTVQSRSVAFQCNDTTNRCDVSGMLEWRWSSWAHALTTSGSGHFSFTIALTNVGLRIISEAEELMPTGDNVGE